ncbi:hypothetical protein TTHERM_01472430, partial (macronuclear) [Tetrahymena thermophila SB210]
MESQNQFTKDVCLSNSNSMFISSQQDKILLDLEEYLIDDKFKQFSSQNLRLLPQSSIPDIQQAQQIQERGNYCDNEKQNMNLPTLKKTQKIYRMAGSKHFCNIKNTTEMGFRVCQGLLISNEGIIRTDYNNVQLSFGYLYNASIVNYLKLCKVVEVQYESIQPNFDVQLQNACNYLLQTPCQHIQESINVIQNVYQKKMNYRIVLQQLKLTQELLSLINDQLNQFLERCDNYIKQYAQQNEGTVFQYFIRK